MANKLSYERYSWFDAKVRAQRFPNARKLADHFEISRKQAQRDIEFMEERLGAPLSYSAEHRGYHYSESGYQLPPVWLTEEEVLALCVAVRLAAAVPDKGLKAFLHNFLEKFITLRSTLHSAVIKGMDEKISVKNMGYYKVEEAVFHQVVAALFQENAVRITYRTPYTMEVTERLVQPLHLVCYMGNWHLIAFCTLRGELRDFALSRITRIERAEEQIAMPEGFPSIKKYIRQSFGVMAGESTRNVVLRFGSSVAPRIAEQVWHEAQQMANNEDGSLHLTFPVSGFEEVAREVLKYGAEVEVLAPEELREIVQAEIQKMAQIY
ncbi:MAG TPA: WYL domain-containing protein [Deltaproteobacteria bacterium]|nr:WYL domain-containing protein [Deltaproteobacteria bacterium]